MPTNDTRYRASLGRKFFGILIGGGFLAAFTLSLKSIRDEWMLVVVVAVLATFTVAILVDVLLQLAGRPRNYAVDETGLWLGRGENLVLLVRWSDVQRWEIRHRRKRGFLASFETAAGRREVEECDVELPGWEPFYDALSAHVSIAPERWDILPTARSREQARIHD